MSYPTSAEQSSASIRLGYVISGKWKTGNIQRLGQTAATTGLFKNDLGESTGNQVEVIYNAYIKKDLNDLVNKYVQYKYGSPSTPDEVVLFQLKSTLILEYFKNKESDILEAIKPVKKNVAGSYAYISGDKHGQKAAPYDIWIGQSSSTPSILKLLHQSIQLGVDPSDEAIHEVIMDSFGLSTFLDDQHIPGVRSAGVQSGAQALENITASNQSALNALKAATQATIGRSFSTNPTDEEKRSLNQCALITDLLHGGYSKTYYPTVWDQKRTGTSAGTGKRTGKDNNAFAGRIYPVRTNRFNPDNLINMCTMPRNINSWLNDTSAKDSSSVQWDLFWVYKTMSGIKESRITPNTKNLSERANLISELLKQNVIDRNKSKDLDASLKADWMTYELISAVVKFDGTNPSTARNDVKVDLEFKLGSMAALESACAYLVLETVEQTTKTVANPGGVGNSSTPIKELVTLKLYDLVTAPVTSTFESEVVAPASGQQTTREFKPDYSRIRLKAKATNATDIKDTDLILDLSTVGHSVTRSASDASVVLKINYRGYFEESLSAPYNDALADVNIINSRIARAARIIDAKNKKCSNKLLRDLVRINQEEERIQVQAYHDNGGLIKRIYDEGILYQYHIDKSKYNLGVAGSTLDPRLNYVSAISQFNNAQQAAANAAAQQGTQAAVNTALAAAQNSSNATYLRMSGGGALIPPPSNSTPPTLNLPQVATYTSIQDAIDQSGDYFFWLGDLMLIILDCLYKTDDNEMRKHSENLNMRFIMGTIRVPDPMDLTKTITINPLQIPIDMGFFASWYNDAIVKKGVTSYPVGVFIKDLIERLVNDVIYDTCFAVLLPDENPPLLRSSFFTDHSNKWFKTYDTSTNVTSKGIEHGTWFDPLDPYDSNYTRRLSRIPNILMKKDITQPIKNSKNYCVIYQQMPSYFRQLRYTNSPLSKDPYCPTIFHGRNMTDVQYTGDISFNQQGDGSYLKEARFFQAQGGNLNLMSNVYDLSFKLIGPKISTIFYPGNIINFILTDFAGGNNKSISSLPYNYSGTESDPHTRGTMSQILGMGGYHIVKSVTYTFNKEFTGENTQVLVDTKFIGTDAKNTGNRQSSSIPNANEPKVCIDLYNNSVDSVRQTENDTGIEAAPFNYVAGGTNSPTNTGSNETTLSRETEVAPRPTASTTTPAQSPSSLQSTTQPSNTSKPKPDPSMVATTFDLGPVDATSWFGNKNYTDWKVEVTKIDDKTTPDTVIVYFKVTRKDGSTYTSTASAIF